jgi:hypothetical protein
MHPLARASLVLWLVAVPAAADPGSDAMAGPPEIPNLPSKETELEVKLPVCNVGESAATGPLLVRLVVKQDAAPAGTGPLLDTTTEVESIAAGECAEKPASFTVTLPESGGYDFTFEIDPDGESGDTNPDNNHGYKHVVAS